MVPRARDIKDVDDIDNFVEVRDVDIDDRRFDIGDISEDMDFVDPVEIEDLEE